MLSTSWKENMYCISDAGKVSDAHSDLNINTPVLVSLRCFSFVNGNTRWEVPQGWQRI